MPFDSVDELPGRVKEKVPKEKWAQWRAVFNSVYADTGDEGRAFAAAYSAVKKDADFSLDFDIAKTDDEKQLVFGWLSVAADKDGNVIIDKEGDIIEEDELENAAYWHVLHAREADQRHDDIVIGKLVESMVFTMEKQEILGIPQGCLPIGWWAGYRVEDEPWQKIKDGEYASFSVGGKAIREVVDAI